MRILGIDPNYRGVGYAAIEGGRNLIAWGIANRPSPKSGESGLPARARHDQILARIDKLIDFLKPDVIVFEAWKGADSRRSLDMRILLHRISQATAKKSIRSFTYSRVAMFNALAEYDIRTKHDIAVFFGRLFPELEYRIPRKRKPWESENVWLSMFKAVALAFVRGEKLS